MNADCIWRSISIQHVQIEAGLNSDPGNYSFWDKSVTLSMLIDLLTSTCRSTQVKSASTDLWPQGMFTFSEMLALVESESSFDAYVCHRRPGGSTAISDLVKASLARLFDLYCFAFSLVGKRVKVIKKIVWIGERENEGMKAFSFLFLQPFVVIYGQSWSEQQKNCAIVRVCLNSQSISCTSGWCEAKECGDLLTLHQTWYINSRIHRGWPASGRVVQANF